MWTRVRRHIAEACVSQRSLSLRKLESLTELRPDMTLHDSNLWSLWFHLLPKFWAMTSVTRALYYLRRSCQFLSTRLTPLLWEIDLKEAASQNSQRRIAWEAREHNPDSRTPMNKLQEWTSENTKHQISSNLIKPSSNLIKPRQISSNLIIPHQISWKIIKSHQISSALIKSHQLSSTLIKSHQTSSYVVKSHQTSSNLTKSHQISSNLIKPHQISSNLIKPPQI